MKKIRTIRRTQEHNEILDNSFITPGRFRELDGLRGIAALAVVIGHFGATFNQNYIHSPQSPYSFPLGEMGVQLFFIISGYVILLTAIKSGSALKFMISRVARLYPTYWFGIIIATLVYVLYGNPGRHITQLQVLLNTTMMQRFIMVEDVDKVYWTLAVEMQFYLLVATYILFRRGKIYRREITVGIIIWSVIGTILCLVIGMPHNSLDKIVLWSVLAEHAPLFCLGMVLFMYSHDRRFTWLIPLLTIMASINTYIMRDMLHAVTMLGICVIFFIVVYCPRVPFLAHGPIHFVGVISYPLYLGHAMLGYMIINILIPYLGDWGARGFTIILVIFWAYIVHITIETNVSVAFRKLLTRVLVTGRKKSCE